MGWPTCSRLWSHTRSVDSCRRLPCEPVINDVGEFKDTILVESALVIASHLTRDKVGRMYGQALAKIQNGDIDDPYFGHYLEAFASWDLGKLLELVHDGKSR